MRVLLLYSNQTRDLVPAPPIGLAYVASAAHRAGHAVRVLDLLHSAEPASELGRAIRAFAPEVVGISVRNIDNVVLQRLTWHLGELAGLIAVVRAETRAAIVLGGPAVSILGGAALRHLDADFAVVGEGEVAFPRLLEEMAGGRRYETIEGLCFRDGARVVVTAPARLPRFAASGMEAWVDWPTYERDGGTWAIQTKRGCPLRCSYCAYPAIEGGLVRRRPARDVVDEMERVVGAVGPRTFEIVDSTFNMPPEHAMAVCREIIHRGLRVSLTAMGVNPLGASAELFTLMRRAGFNSMMITPEAASDKTLRSLRKDFTVEHVHRAADLARRSGIASAWFFMLGGPGETRETVEETIGFAERQLTWRRCLVIVMTGVRILPGTELARSAVAEGYLEPDQNLAEPVFYFSPDVSEAWVLDRIQRAIARRPNIVHAAEESGPLHRRVLPAVLRPLGVPPPYWRFLPWVLRLPPLPTLRRRNPGVVPGSPGVRVGPGAPGA